ncbi:1-aminocyclopropane-1-carboxylate oxidase homolog 5-like [Cornus florida]|uniref:1-aminocyclopropane-1-carboxylate oxidase homolog 5-like n=1 Tax=Cornus florida TaxID=4283 RepID=UPI0028984DB5|nr:1-aminocyclopropane-1-carboxylate oxidase homolog 5-like [Cornus florida]
MEVMPNTAEVAATNQPEYDRAKEVKEFDETKAGVKGLMDSGVVKIPRMFIHPPENLGKASLDTSGIHLQVPLIDLKDLHSGRMEIVNEIGKAAETWGFFQMVNHGIPLVMKEMIEGVRRFHEQPNELKTKWYSSDSKQRVRYYCNGDLHISKAANWRDSIACKFDDCVLESDALPLVCFGGGFGPLKVRFRSWAFATVESPHRRLRSHRTVFRSAAVDWH